MDGPHCIEVFSTKATARKPNGSHHVPPGPDLWFHTDLSFASITLLPINPSTIRVESNLGTQPSAIVEVGALNSEMSKKTTVSLIIPSSHTPVSSVDKPESPSSAGSSRNSTHTGYLSGNNYTRGTYPNPMIRQVYSQIHTQQKFVHVIQQKICTRMSKAALLVRAKTVSLKTQ